MVHPVTEVQDPESSHDTLLGVAVPSYPVAQVTVAVPSYVVEVTSANEYPVSEGVSQSNNSI